MDSILMGLIVLTMLVVGFVAAGEWNTISGANDCEIEDISNDYIFEGVHVFEGNIVGCSSNLLGLTKYYDEENVVWLRNDSPIFLKNIALKHEHCHALNQNTNELECFVRGFV